MGDEDEEPLSPADRAAIEQEAAELESFAALAASIDQNAKGEALLKALAIAFDKAQALGAERKAIIFTESRRTQAYSCDGSQRVPTLRESSYSTAATTTPVRGKSTKHGLSGTAGRTA